jgi:hypothetical protein
MELVAVTVAPEAAAQATSTKFTSIVLDPEKAMVQVLALLDLRMAPLPQVALELILKVPPLDMVWVDPPVKVMYFL